MRQHHRSAELRLGITSGIRPGYTPISTVGVGLAIGFVALLATASPAMAGGTVKADIDNRNGFINASDNVGDPAEYDFFIDSRNEFDPLNIDQTVQENGRIAHLVHASQFLGADPANSMTGFMMSETITATKPAGVGFAEGGGSQSISFTVTGSGGMLLWNYSGMIDEQGGEVTITLVGPGVNSMIDSNSSWNGPVVFTDGEYTLSVTRFANAVGAAADSESLSYSVNLLAPSCDGADAGSCYAVHPGNGCDLLGCCNTVCNTDPSCCTTGWDQGCVDLAIANCATASVSGVVINPANGHRYQLVSPAGWNDYVTFAAAQDFGGTFGCPATINDGFENQWVRCYLASNVPNIDAGAAFSNWVGLNDVDSEGTFEWWCAEPVTYTNWLTGEPNNGGNSDFTELLGDSGQWRDRGAAALEYGVTEFEFIVCGTGGGCFSTHAAPGCNNESCCQTVCFIDSFCCESSWDTICVDEANGLCNPGIVAGPIFNPANMHNYYLLETGAWSEAQEKAQSLNGYLATINNMAENTWVLNNVSRFDGNMTRICFIGSNDQVVEGTFQWVNHGTSTYANWAAGEPNNSGGDEDFAEMLADGLWRDNDNTGTIGFTTFAIVEVPCTGDFDGNGTVDGADLGLLLGAWNTTDKTTDINQDGVVDGADLGIVLGGWGSCG